jgi:intraflagellar transport protein 172
LVRYAAEIRVDKVFYDAGMACKDDAQLNMAFVFLRRYLEIADAIEDPESGASALSDTSDFDGTDIPTYNIPLPRSNFTNESERENIRDWIL